MLGKTFLRVLILGSGFIGPLEASFPEEKDPDFYADRTQRETPHSKKWDAKNLRKGSPKKTLAKRKNQGDSPDFQKRMRMSETQ